MPSVHFEAENRTVEVPEGATLRQAAKQANVSVHASVNKWINCRGLGLCGTDRVKLSPTDCISPPTFREKLQLGTNPKERLACQVKIRGDVTVDTAPAMEYGVVMLDNVKFVLLAGVFGLLTLATVVFMLFEMIGKPLF